MRPVAEFRSQDRLERSQQLFLLIYCWEDSSEGKIWSRSLYLCRVSVCSLCSATIFPIILIAYFIIDQLLLLRAWIIVPITIQSLTIASMDSSSLVLVSQQRVLNTIQWLPEINLKSYLYDIFFQYMWLTSTQSCWGSLDTTFRMSASLPSILLPAAIMAIYRMSAELTLRQRLKSCSNYLATAWQFQNSFSSKEANIQSDSQSMCPSISKLSSVLVRNTARLLLRQKEMVCGASGGSGEGMGA